MKRFLSFFYTDIQWKLLSVMLAFLLWLVAANMNDPVQNRNFNIPLQYYNMEILAREGLMLVNGDALNTPVQVGIRAHRSELDVLNATVEEQLRRIVPSVDFRSVNTQAVLNSEGPVTMRLDISANLYAGLEHNRINPSFIEVQIDAIAIGSFPVVYDILNDVAPGFELRPIRLVNNNVTITGPRAVFATIDSVRVAVDVLGLHADAEMNGLPLVVLTRDGQDITDQLQLSVMETTATVPVWAIQATELRVRSTGNAADGFAVAAIDIEPLTIDVIGTPDNLQQLEYILVEIELYSIREDYVHNVNIEDWLPSGILLRSGENPQVDLTIKVEPIDLRVFFVPRDNVRIRGFAAIYQILSEQAFIRIDLVGPRSLINALTYADIGLELDLRNLPIGTRNVTLTVSVPEGTTMVRTAPSLLVQIHEPAGADDDDYDHYPPDTQDPQVPIVVDPSDNGDNNGNNNENTNGNGGEEGYYGEDNEYNSDYPPQQDIE